LTAATPRDEIRSITCTPHVADLNFPGVYQACAITREVFDLHGNPLRTRNETVYALTSLTTYQANPADVLTFNRGHWRIENREHHVRDVTFDEDRSQVRTGSSPQIMAHEKHRDQPPPPRRLDQHQTSHRENEPPPRPSPHTPRRLTSEQERR
jgi:hypothetical protein